MVTLTQSVFDVADCNITQHYLGAAAADTPLPFTSLEKYNAFYKSIVAKKTKYADVRQQEGVVVDQLRGAYSANKFWQRYLGSRDEETYAESAWENVVPVAATWKQHLEVVLPAGWKVKVAPAPRLLLHPFGWSTWINFLINGEHSLDDLAAITAHLVEGAAYHFAGESGNALTLQQLFDRVGKGVRQDVFGGAAFTPQDVLTVATVLGKHGGSPSLGALTEEQEKALKRIVRSDTAAPAKTLAVPLKKGESELLDFIVHDGMAWFLWAEHRLRPFERNAQRLRCYHNNTVRSLLLAWLLQTFLAQALKIKPWSAALADLAGRATQLLAAPTYKNLSMLSFLERKEFEAARAGAEKRL